MKNKSKYLEELNKKLSDFENKNKEEIRIHNTIVGLKHEYELELKKPQKRIDFKERFKLFIDPKTAPKVEEDRINLERFLTAGLISRCYDVIFDIVKDVKTSGKIEGDEYRLQVASMSSILMMVDRAIKDHGGLRHIFPDEKEYLFHKAMQESFKAHFTTILNDINPNVVDFEDFSREINQKVEENARKNI